MGAVEVETYGRNWETPEGVDWKSLQGHLELLQETFARSESVPEKLDLGLQGAAVIEKGQAGGLEPCGQRLVACRLVGSWMMPWWC